MTDESKTEYVVEEGGDWTYEKFMRSVQVSMEDLCREIYRSNRDTIKIKNEERAVKNLVSIYNATLGLSFRKGFPTMTLRDLCRQSGLSMGALYSYISCKEDLLKILQDVGFSYNSRILIRFIESCEHPTGKLRVFIRTRLYLSETIPRLFTFFFMETRGLGSEDQKKSIASELFTEQLFVNILEEGKHSGDFTVDDPVMVAALVKPMLQDWYLKRWKYSGRGVSVDQYADAVIDIVETYIMK